MILEAGTIWDHLPPAVLGAMITGAVALGVYFVNRSRAEGKAEAELEKNNASSSAVWKRIDEMRVEIDKAKVDLALLQATVQNLPSHDHLRERMESLEDKIDKKLDRLRDELKEIFETTVSKWACPKSGGQV